MESSYDRMEFHLTTPPADLWSYEEKRKYNKRKSGQYLGEECKESPYPKYVRSTRRKLSHDM